MSKKIKHPPHPLSPYFFKKSNNSEGGLSCVGEKQFEASQTCSNLSESLKTSLLAASVSDLHLASFSKAESSRVRLQEGSMRQEAGVCILDLGRIMHKRVRRARCGGMDMRRVLLVLKHFFHSFASSFHRICLRRRNGCKRKALSHPSCPLLSAGHSFWRGHICLVCAQYLFHFWHDSILDRTVQNLQMSILERNIEKQIYYNEDLFDIHVRPRFFSGQFGNHSNMDRSVWARWKQKSYISTTVM